MTRVGRRFHRTCASSPQPFGSSERDAVGALQSHIDTQSVAFVPLLDHDVHDIDTLTVVARYLLRGAPAGSGRH